MYSIQVSLLLSFIDEYSLHDLQRYPLKINITTMAVTIYTNINAYYYILYLV